MSYTKGPWRIGTRCNSVVSDDNSGISIGGATGDDAVEYYGGNLIAESISECNLSIIAAAPEMLNALKTLEEAARSRGIPTEAARYVISRAEGRSDD